MPQNDTTIIVALSSPIIQTTISPDLNIVSQVVTGGAGYSAYELWLQEGHTGTEEDFLNSLKGPTGSPGYTPIKGVDYFDGKDGKDGIDGDVSPIFTMTNGGILSNSMTLGTDEPGQIIDITDVNVARTIKYMVQATYGTNYLSTELLILHNSTDTYLTEYKTLTTGLSLATFSCNIENGYIRLIANPLYGGIVFKFIKTYINI